MESEGAQQQYPASKKYCRLDALCDDAVVCSNMTLSKPAASFLFYLKYFLNFKEL